MYLKYCWRQKITSKQKCQLSLNSLPGSTGASKLEKMRRGLIAEEEEKEDKSGPSWFVLNRVRSHQAPATCFQSHYQPWRDMTEGLFDQSRDSFDYVIYLQLDQYDISRNRREYRFFMYCLHSKTGLFFTGQRSSLMSPSSKQKRESRANECGVCVSSSTSEIYMMIGTPNMYTDRYIV